MDYENQLRVQKVLNGIISTVVVLFFLLCAAYALFALYDNQRIYHQAENVQADMLKLKPQQTEDDEGASFAELLAINPEVQAWITMENTKIDFPILQGENNLCYINQDVYGNFSVAGSIFLDYRNQPDFSDCYNLLYGHHMENSNMFGDLDHYKDEDFFRQYPHGELLLPEGSFDLTAFAVLLVQSSDEAIFAPQPWEYSWQENLQYVRVEALHLDPVLLDSLTEESQILALTTCSSEFTDARTVLLTVMEPQNS